MSLNEGQQKVADAVNAGSSVLVYSPGGCGKSYLANSLKTKKSLTFAPTGTAARQVDGVTNHTGFGAKIGVITPEMCMKPAKPDVLKPLVAADKLFLDELPFTRYDMVKYIDHQLRMANKTDIPFGGKQVIATGDPYQMLAFCGSKQESTLYKQHYGNKLFSFQYEELNLLPFELTQQMRQEDEREAMIMNSLRKMDKYLPLAVKRINELSTPYEHYEDVTQICAINKDADVINKLRYDSLTTKEVVFDYEHKGKPHELAKEVPIGIQFKAKEGMRVMFIANNLNTWEWTNGSTGTIVQIEDDCLFVRQDDGRLSIVGMQKFEAKKYASSEKRGIYQKSIGHITGFPVRLAFASTIAKAQGATLGKAAVNLGSNYTSWCHGLPYVAMSRFKRIEDIRLVRPLCVEDFYINPIVRKMFG